MPTPQVAVRIKVNFVKYCLAHSRCSQCHIIPSVGPRHICFSFERNESTFMPSKCMTQSSSPLVPMGLSCMLLWMFKYLGD